jgi:hypothetical protein
MKPVGSELCSQEPATVPCPQSHDSKTHSEILFLWSIIFPRFPRSSKTSLPFRFADCNKAWISHLSHACYMLHPSSRPLFVNPNKIRWRVQMTKLLSSSLFFFFQYSKLTISVVNWFLKNATDNETTDTEVLNPVLKWPFVPINYIIKHQIHFCANKHKNLD